MLANACTTFIQHYIPYERIEAHGTTSNRITVSHGSKCFLMVHISCGVFYGYIRFDLEMPLKLLKEELTRDE